MGTEKTTIGPDGTKTIEKTIVKLADTRGGIEKPRQTGDAARLTTPLPLHRLKYRILSSTHLMLLE
jgi:hypothetical protein